ncbi:Glucosamine 6-phosphate N-acetyltransferase [Lachnellula occidentalis]|uniref:Glucosamine 6-phosphate N-acetyltransferase n=1 Tax=Lachnellula occidentalis TaxID=215460 RepID=A0A8H8UA43_9HELO|nr:Glucosamine 6-phosphate N-acetyltransferase [Lachnellula occidentalis]
MASQTEETLFPSSLIPQKATKGLPQGFLCRPLQRTDFARGHLAVLAHLAPTGATTEAQWIAQYEWMARCNGTYFIVVLVDEERDVIVGTGTLTLERNFMLNLGKQGHIKDVVITAEQQGKGLGIRLIQALDLIGEQLGCYKTILDCEPKNEAFYRKCGYERTGIDMQHCYNQTA